jgi:hypothetical protein
MRTIFQADGGRIYHLARILLIDDDGAYQACVPLFETS